MDAAKLNDWLQVVGIFAVVLSLIFVGLQMKQSQEIAIAAQYQARTASTIESLSARSQISIVSQQIGVRISEGFAAYDSHDWSPNELGGMLLNAQMLISGQDNVHFQWESGFMSDDAWNSYRTQVKSTMSRPMGRYILENYGGSYRPSFRKICLDLIAEIEAESN